MKKFGTAIILAGGKSSRMGFDKQFLRINEIRLMEIVISKLKVEFDEIVIVTNKPELYKDSPYIITSDTLAGKGPLGGIHAGLLLTSSEYAYVIACDMPNINIDYIKYMKGKINDSQVCITNYKDWVEPFNGFYSREIIKDIEDYLSISGTKGWIIGLYDMVDVTYILEEDAKKFSPDWKMFENLNTVEDLERFLKDNNIKKE